MPIAHYVLAANALLLMVRLSVWTRLWRRHVRSLNQQQVEVDFWRMTTSLNLHLTWPIIVLCVVLAALAFAVLDELRHEGVRTVKIASAGTGMPVEVAQAADLVVDGPTDVVALFSPLG